MTCLDYLCILLSSSNSLLNLASFLDYYLNRNTVITFFNSAKKASFQMNGRWLEYRYLKILPF